MQISAVIPSVFKGDGASNKRLVSLDFLRFVAIVLVLFHHSVIPTESAGVIGPVAEVLRRGGWAGVDLFFVLSGLLISTLLFKEYNKTDKFDLSRFWIRRAFKIFPLYYLYILLGFAAILWRTDFDFGYAIGKAAGNLFHIQNYYGTPFSHTWSLAVEEHFYLALPVVLAMTFGVRAEGGRTPVLVSVLSAILVGCLLFRLGYYFSGSIYTNKNVQWPTHMRIDALTWGVFLGYLLNFKGEPLRSFFCRFKLWIFLGSVLLVAPVLLMDIKNPFIWTVGFTFNYLGFGGLVMLAYFSEDFLRRSRILRASAWVGGYSYAIYLFHFGLTEPVIAVLLRTSLFSGFGELRWIVFFSVYAITAVASGVLLGSLIERPSLILRDMLFPARSAIMSANGR